MGGASEGGRDEKGKGKGRGREKVREVYTQWGKRQENKEREERGKERLVLQLCTFIAWEKVNWYLMILFPLIDSMSWGLLFVSLSPCPS